MSPEDKEYHDPKGRFTIVDQRRERMLREVRYLKMSAATYAQEKDFKSAAERHEAIAKIYRDLW